MLFGQFKALVNVIAKYFTLPDVLFTRDEITPIVVDFPAPWVQEEHKVSLSHIETDTFQRL